MSVTHARCLIFGFSIFITGFGIILLLLINLQNDTTCFHGMINDGNPHLRCFVMLSSIRVILGLISEARRELILLVDILKFGFDIIIKTRILSFEALSLVYQS